jgi:UPF0755 protein
MTEPTEAVSATDDPEIWNSTGNTPLEGTLRGARRYYQGVQSLPDPSATSIWPSSLPGFSPINADPLNRYSTYAHEGLPPGPIANPGIKSLQAVLSPATTKFLYFVARAEGRKHTFSENLDEHNAAVKDLRERRNSEH